MAEAVRRTRSAIIGALAAGIAAAPVQAEVIEISPDGSISRQNGPSVTTSAGVVQLAILPRSVAVASRFRAAYERAGSAAALAPDLIEAVAYVESRHNPQAVSPKGAVGLMQLMPGTAQDLGVDAKDPTANAHGGAAYLRAMLNRYRGDLILALAAYNAGPGAVERYNGVPPFAETQAYVAAVLDRLAQGAQAAGDSP